jgi:hypothetical protein
MLRSKQCFKIVELLIETIERLALPISERDLRTAADGSPEKLRM